MSNKKIEIQVGKETHTVEKAHLKVWLQLSDTYEKFLQASKNSSYMMMAEAIYEYLDLALGGIFDWDRVSWHDTVSIFNKISVLNLPDTSIPIIATMSKKPEQQPWDYPSRNWYAWAHIIAKNYGWELDMIADMEIEDAVAMIQEISLNEQLEHEFAWQLSEIAYPYNSTTKKGEFKPLPRPDWMLPKNKEIKKVMIPRSMLPMGVVENLSGMFAESVVKNDT